MKILLAVDGSSSSAHAVTSLLKHVDWFAEAPNIDLIYVHVPVASPIRSRVGVDHESIQRIYEQDAESALHDIKKQLSDADVAFDSHVLVGDAADQICAFSETHGSDLICMGTRGMGALRNLLLGSTATKVLRKARVPVMLVSDSEAVAQHQGVRERDDSPRVFPPYGI